MVFRFLKKLFFRFKLLEMNIKCNLKELINGLNIVSKTSNSKTTMPILDGVLLEAYHNKLKLTTYDLEIGCEHTLNCNIIEEGKTVIDIKVLNEILRRIEDIEVDLSNRWNSKRTSRPNGRLVVLTGCRTVSSG